MKLEKISPLIKAYKTLDHIGEPGRLNAALHLVSTPFLLHLHPTLLFSSTLNLRKMLDILQTTNSNLVAGNPRGAYSGLMYTRQLVSGVQLVLGTELFVSSDRWSQPPHCLRVDFFPEQLFMARSASLREIGGWNPKLKQYSFLELYLKSKSAEVNPMFCADLTVDILPNSPSPQQLPQYRLLEAIGVDSVVLCKKTNTGYGMLMCEGVHWEMNVCGVDTMFNHVTDKGDGKKMAGVGTGLT